MFPFFKHGLCSDQRMKLHSATKERGVILDNGTISYHCNLSEPKMVPGDLSHQYTITVLGREGEYSTVGILNSFS